MLVCVCKSLICIALAYGFSLGVIVTKRKNTASGNLLSRGSEPCVAETSFHERGKMLVCVCKSLICIALAYGFSSDVIDYKKIKPLR